MLPGKGRFLLNITLFPACLAICLLTGCATPVRTVFVSPGGNDSNTGSQTKPFATLPRAMAAVREIHAAMKRSETPAGPIKVVLRGGNYELREPVVFTPDDSGSVESPVTYTSFDGETAVLSGGERLAGTWRQTPGKPYWQVEIPRACDGGRVFYSLFVNGQSRERTRTPNWGQKVLRAEGREPGGDPRQALRYFQGDVKPSWSNPTDIDVVLLCSWTPTIHRIKEIVPEKRAIRFYSGHFRTVDFWERNFRYYLSNVFEALDEPGEWYLNRKTGILYYYPMPGEDMSKAEVIVPVLKSRMITFEGDLSGGRFIENLHFKNLAFRHIDGDMDKYNGMYRQGHMFLTSAIVARGLRNSSFESCELSQLGEYAMELADGCRNVAVRQCHIWDLGAGALQLGVTDLGTLKSQVNTNAPVDDVTQGERYVRDLVIDNNCIHRLGTIWHGCYGIVNRFASCTRITHNDMFDMHWDAVGLDARWGWKGEKYSYGNVVAYNHLHHLGLRYHTDAAGIYQFGPLDTHIHHNLIHDVVAYPYICGYAGIYLDEQSRKAMVENNLVYKTDWYAYFQHMGIENTFRNNIGAFARNGFIGRHGVYSDPGTNVMESCRNIYITSNAVAISQRWQSGDKPSFLHHNQYHAIANAEPLTFDGKSFAEWQAQGYDSGSSIADPGCRNPAAFDFTLWQDSPACTAIGFVPFDGEIKKAGLYGDRDWCAMPSRYPPRTPSDVWSEKDMQKLNAFELDFNMMNAGDEPGVFRMSEQKGAGFAVTREVAGTKGPQCLKCTDKKGLTKSFYPSLTVTPRILREGKIQFSFSALQPAQNAVSFTVEFRGRGQGNITGPSIAVARDGVVKANGRSACTLKPDCWTRFEISFVLGEESMGNYTLVTDGPDGKKTLTCPFGGTAFDQIGWLGIIAPDNSDGCFYLDDVKLTINDR